MFEILVRSDHLSFTLQTRNTSLLIISLSHSADAIQTPISIPLPQHGFQKYLHRNGALKK